MRSSSIWVWLWVVVLLIAASPMSAATTATGDEKNECRDTANGALDVFEAWRFNVPLSVAEPYIEEIYAACYEPARVSTSSDVPVPEYPPNAITSVTVEEQGKDLKEIAKLDCEGDCGLIGSILGLLSEFATCSGGGSTLLGFSNTAYILGQRVHIVNEPASSYYELVLKDKTLWSVEGYTRSAANNIEVSPTPSDISGQRPGHVAYWDWLNIPMGGEVSWSWRCVGFPGGPYTLTSTGTTGEGTPFGDPIVEDVLKVVVDGRTCLVPC